jgi:hypothetical protein
MVIILSREEPTHAGGPVNMMFQVSCILDPVIQSLLLDGWNISHIQG